jgi:hypothetical protein
MEPIMDRLVIDLKTLEKELQAVRRARIEAENAGLDLESLIDQIRLGFSLQEIELGLAAPAAPH